MESCPYSASVWEFEKSWKTQWLLLLQVKWGSWVTFALCLVLSYLYSCQIQGENQRDNTRRDAFLHRQSPVSMSPSPWGGCMRSGAPLDPNPATRSLLRPGRRPSRSPPPPFRSCSIPIIPSVQCHNDNEVSCMQTSISPATTAMSATCKEEKRKKQGHVTLSSSSCSSAIGQQQDEVALLLEEAQEQLRALVLAHRKQEEGGFGGGSSTAALVDARETVCFLNLNGSAGALSCNGPTQTQLLSPSLSHRDLGQCSQWKDTIRAFTFGLTVFDRLWCSASVGRKWKCWIWKKNVISWKFWKCADDMHTVWIQTYKHVLSGRLHTDWQYGKREKKKNIYMHLFTKQEKHFYLGKKKPNSLSNPCCF